MDEWKEVVVVEFVVCRVFGIRDIKLCIHRWTTYDHVNKDTCDFVAVSLLSYTITMSCLVSKRLGNWRWETFCICHITTYSHVTNQKSSDFVGGGPLS